MGGQTTVHVTHTASVARIMMARPEVHNAFNEDLISHLHAAFADVASDASVRVIVLAGEGKSFSVGADLNWMRRAATWSEEENRRDAIALTGMLRAVAECPKPVVARVQGAAMGGGAGLTACADVAIAAESATFAFSEVRLGLAPATIAPHVIARIGAGRALPLFLTGERFDARRALEIGLVHRVVPDAELDAAVDGAVAALLAGSPHAQAACKQLVREVTDRPRGEIDAYTAQLIAALRVSDEGREGVAAFLDKRKPRWAE